MFVRYEKERHSELFESDDVFILMVYFMNQGKYDEKNKKFYESLALYPSFIVKLDENNGITLTNHVVEFEKLFPDLKIVEAYHHEIHDFVEELGFSYEWLWRKDGIFRPMIFAFKSRDEFEHSYSKCYCADTLVEFAHYIRPDLFIPPSVSES